MIVDMETNAYAYMLPMIEHNLGFGFIPDFMVNDSLKKEKPIELNLIEHYDSRHIYGL